MTNHAESNTYPLANLGQSFYEHRLASTQCAVVGSKLI
jgi:hypothetical protein